MAVNAQVEQGRLALENRKLDIEEGKAVADAEHKRIEAYTKGQQEGIASVPQVDPAQISEAVAGPLVQYMDQRLQALAEQQAEGMTGLGQVLAQISQQIEAGNQQVVAAVTAPKRVVYENGRPKGVETVIQ